jgi:hypothetical protein
MKKNLITLLLCFIFLISLSSSTFAYKWQQLLSPNTQIMDFVINKKNPTHFAVSSKKGVAYTKNEGQYWEFYPGAPLFRLTNFQDDVYILAGINLDLSKKTYKNYFTYQYLNSQKAIFPADSIKYYIMNLTRQTRFEYLSFSTTSPHKIFVSTLDSLYSCVITSITKTNPIKSTWQRISWQHGPIKYFIVDDKETLWIFSDELNKKSDLKFSLWHYNPREDKARKKRLMLMDEGLTQAPKITNIIGQNYIYNPDQLKSFFSGSNIFIYSDDNEFSFRIKTVLKTKDNITLYPLYLSGSDIHNIYLLARYKKTSRLSSLDIFKQIKQDIIPQAELDQKGQEKYGVTWKFMSESEKETFKNNFLNVYIAERKKQLESENKANKEDPFSLGLFHSTDFGQTFTPLLNKFPKDINPKKSKIVIHPQTKILYLVNQGVWKLIKE